MSPPQNTYPLDQNVEIHRQRDGRYLIRSSHHILVVWTGNGWDVATPIRFLTFQDALNEYHSKIAAGMPEALTLPEL